MRTWIDIDDDVLRAAKEIAEQKHQSTGKVVSDLLRKALQPQIASPLRNGIRVLQFQSQVPTTMAMVNRIRDEE